MEVEHNERSRETWTARINLRRVARVAIRELAAEEKISVATMLGIAIETYVIARST